MPPSWRFENTSAAHYTVTIGSYYFYSQKKHCGFFANATPARPASQAHGILCHGKDWAKGVAGSCFFPEKAVGQGGNIHPWPQATYGANWLWTVPHSFFPMSFRPAAYFGICLRRFFPVGNVPRCAREHLSDRNILFQLHKEGFLPPSHGSVGLLAILTAAARFRVSCNASAKQRVSGLKSAWLPIHEKKYSSDTARHHHYVTGL
jgi:hypothetical protein